MSFWKRLVSSQHPSPAPSQNVHYGRSLEELSRRLQRMEHPRVLDLGHTSGSNIDFFHRLGCKVHVDDYASSLIHRPPRPEPDQESGHGDRRPVGKRKPAVRPLDLPPVDYEESQFDAVLSWDLFDYLDRDEAAFVARELDRVTHPGGFLLALFGPAAGGGRRRARRYHIEAECRVRAEQVPGQDLQPHHYPNRDIARLFPHYEIGHTVLLKDGTREILLRKMRRPAHGKTSRRLVALA